jgi:hypothetical protein
VSTKIAEITNRVFVFGKSEYKVSAYIYIETITVMKCSRASFTPNIL